MLDFLLQPCLDLHTHSHDEVICDMVPTLVQFEKARQRCKAVCQCVSCGMQCQIAQLGQSTLVYEDVRKRRVVYGILQLEDCHLAHRFLLRAQSGDQIGDIHAVHIANNIVEYAKIWEAYAAIVGASRSPSVACHGIRILSKQQEIGVYGQWRLVYFTPSQT
jgi:hypothetical protein